MARVRYGHRPVGTRSTLGHRSGTATGALGDWRRLGIAAEVYSMEIVFARLGNKQKAEALLADVRRRPEGERPLRVFVHEHAVGEDLAEQVQHGRDSAETDGRHGLFVGLVTGAVVGALVGTVLHFAFGWTPSLGSGIGIGVLTGVLVGGILAALVGTGLTDRRLAQLGRGLMDQEVLVTFEMPDAAAREALEATVRSYGGRFAEKSAV
jgi:hypothetical protein